jgi:hypothetical protein
MIRGLPMGQYDLIECQAVEYALTEVFSEWVVEDTSVVPGMGYGFIRVSVCVLFVCLLERGMHVMLWDSYSAGRERFTASAMLVSRRICCVGCCTAVCHSGRGGRSYTGA